MNWKELIIELSNEYRLTERELASKINVSQATINKIKRSPEHQPFQNTIKNIEAAFSIKIDNSDPTDIRYKKVELAKEYNKVDDRLFTYPVISEVYAGISPGYIVAEQIIDYISIPYQKKENVFAVKVIGDSMNHKIEEGDIILVDMDAVIHNNTIVVVRLKNGEQIIKRYRQLDNRTIMFYSDNGNYDPRIMPISDIEIIYKVVKIIKDIN